MNDMALPIASKKPQETQEDVEKQFVKAQTQMAQSTSDFQTMGMLQQSLPMQSYELQKHRTTPPEDTKDILHQISGLSFIPDEDKMALCQEARRIARNCETHGLHMLKKDMLLEYYGMLFDYKSLNGNETKWGNRTVIDIGRGTGRTDDFTKK
jgi:hypothetical protein